MDTSVEQEDEFQVVFPEVFPEQDEVYLLLLEAVRACVASNVMRPVHTALLGTLGDSSDIFDTSVMYRNIGMDGGLDLFRGRPAVQQMIGKVLHDSEVMTAFVHDEVNCLVGPHSTLNTRVTTLPTSNTVSVLYKMPFNELALRYLRQHCVSVQVDSTSTYMCVQWNITCPGTDTSGILYVAEFLESALTIYYKLLTRFPTCQSYSNSLPGFRNS